MTDLTGVTIAFLAADGVEQVELTRPWQAVVDNGGRPLLVSIDTGQIRGFHHLEPADRFPVDGSAADVDPADFDGLVLPGGVANPDFLRTDGASAGFVRSFFDGGRPVAAICHAPWTLIEADVVSGRTLTSWPSLRTDLRNAGANWVDREAVVCEEGPNVLVTSREPDDLDAFCPALVERFASAPARPSIR